MQQCTGCRLISTNWGEIMKKVKLFIQNYLYSLKIAYQAARWHYVLKLVLTILLAFFPFVNIYVWRNIINLLTNLQEHNIAIRLLYYVILYLLLYLISQVLERLSTYIQYKYNDRVNIYIENMLIEKFKDVDLAFYDSSELYDKFSHVGQIISSVVGLSIFGFDTLRIFLVFISSLLLLSMLSIGYIVLILVLFIPVCVCKWKANKLSNEFDRDNAVIQRRTEYFKGQFKNVHNLFDIKLFGLKDFFITKFSMTWLIWYKKLKTHTAITSALMLVGLVISSFANQIFLYINLIDKLARQVIQIGDAIYYISVFNQFYTSTDDLLSCLLSVQFMHERIAIVQEFLSMEPDVPKTGFLVPCRISEITFSHVSFKYPGTENYVLRDCSFTIKNGETVGMVGENGAGKSTIVKLLLRFYDVTEGKIMLDSVDIRDYDIVAYRKLFSVLFQDFIKYSFTLRENIVLSDYEQRNDGDKITYAIQQSGINEIIKNWGKGLDTHLTRFFEEDGKELSGGQWQMVALSRVFFADHPFVILDEPSASLDALSEEKIFQQFSMLSKQRSTLIISHRLSSIVNADMIIVLKDGCVHEQGTHKELLNKGEGYYAEMFKLQASRYHINSM